MKRIFLLATMFALPSTGVLAQINTDALIAGYQAEGYTGIAVTPGLTETRVEAIRDTFRVDVVYDNSTGEVLNSDFSAADDNGGDDNGTDDEGSDGGDGDHGDSDGDGDDDHGGGGGGDDHGGDND